VFLKHRSYKKELLDGDAIPFADIMQNMQELNVINHRLGGHAITVKGVQQLLQHKNELFKNPISIMEIGCGGGDNLRVIKAWAFKKGIAVHLTGIDINAACIAYAAGQPQNKDIHFVCADYKEIQFTEKPHLIFSSLFCHHFNDDEIVWMLQWMQQNSTTGFFINDLHRHPLAYYSIKMLTQTFSKSHLVKNDAPLSVLRGFVKKDWEKLFQKANVQPYAYRWQWAFRWLITHKK